MEDSKMEIQKEDILVTELVVAETLSTTSDAMKIPAAIETVPAKEEDALPDAPEAVAELQAPIAVETAVKKEEETLPDALDVVTAQEILPDVTAAPLPPAADAPTTTIVETTIMATTPSPTAGNHKKSESPKEQSHSPTSGPQGEMAAPEEAEESDRFSDTDSAIGSSIHDSVEENGRRYHSFRNGKYVLPNDEQEQERLDMQHHIFGLTLDGSLTTATLPTPLHNVLDVGTGTGIWAIDFAALHPESRIVGIDLSAVQPQFVPPNVEFQICDAEEQWDFSTKFDYVHWRMMTVCFRDVREVFRHAFEGLRPGGVIEVQDCAFPMKTDDGSDEGTALQQWFRYIGEGAAKTGRPFGTEVPNYETHLAAVGFTDIRVVKKIWPVGPWMKDDKKLRELGMWVRADAIDVLQGASMAVFTRALGWTAPQVEVFLIECRNNFMDKSIHGYLDVYCVSAKRPE